MCGADVSESLKQRNGVNIVAIVHMDHGIDAVVASGPQTLYYTTTRTAMRYVHFVRDSCLVWSTMRTWRDEVAGRCRILCSVDVFVVGICLLVCLVCRESTHVYNITLHDLRRVKTNKQIRH